MKNATSYLIVNMSVSEILSTLMIVTVSLAAKIIHPNRFPYINDVFALIFCKTVYFMDSFSHDLAIMSLTIIALDRFLGVKFPLRRIITRGRAKKIIAVIWILAFLATSINLYSARYSNQQGYLRCPRVWAPFPPNSGVINIITQMILFYVVPLCIMGVLYSITVHKLWVRRIPGNVTAANQRLERQTKINVLKMCVTVVVVFALCWLPLYVVRVIELSNTLPCPLPSKVITVVVYVSFTSYAINPWIYFIFSQEYRKGFRDIIKPLKSLCKQTSVPGPLNHYNPQTLDLRSSAVTMLHDSDIEIISIRNLSERAL